MLRVFFRPWVEGLEALADRGSGDPGEQSLVLLGLPSSWPLVSPSGRSPFLAKSDYFTGSGIKGFFSKFFFTSVGPGLRSIVPVDVAAEAAVLTGERVLRGKHLLGIYPEGTRSPNGTMYRGKTGLARMAPRGAAFRSFRWR